MSCGGGDGGCSLGGVYVVRGYECLGSLRLFLERAKAIRITAKIMSITATMVIYFMKFEMPLGVVPGAVVNG